MTRADWDQTEAVFAPDAIVEIASPYDIRLEGGTAIRQFLNEATRGSELLVQTAHSPVIRLIGPNTAHARTTVHELSRGVVAVTTNFAEAGTAVNYKQYGIYYDDAAKVDGEWKIHAPPLPTALPGTRHPDRIRHRGAFNAHPPPLVRQVEQRATRRAPTAPDCPLGSRARTRRCRSGAMRASGGLALWARVRCWSSTA
jgi:hypothetical protein